MVTGDVLHNKVKPLERGFLPGMVPLPGFVDSFGIETSPIAVQKPGQAIPSL
jgi:hypothetical protein